MAQTARAGVPGTVTKTDGDGRWNHALCAARMGTVDVSAAWWSGGRVLVGLIRAGRRAQRSREGEILCALVASLTLACGSRSELVVGGGAAGGAVSGGGTGGGGTGGGVSASPCRQLSVLIPTIGPVAQPLEDSTQLTASSDDQLQFTAAWLGGGGGGPGFVVRHATLRPWDNWPQNGALAPVVATAIETDSTHVVGRSAEARFGLAVRGPIGPRLYPAMPVAGVAASPIELPGIQPMFVTWHREATSHLVGVFDLVGAAQLLRGFLVDENGLATEMESFGCSAGQAPRADAVAFGDGFLVVASRHSGFEKCPGTPGVTPQYVDVLRVTRTTPQTTLTTTTDGSTIIDVAAAPHPDGAYAVWTSSTEGLRTHALRVNAATQAVVGPVTLLDDVQDRVAVGAVGDQLVLARRVDFERIEVSVFDPDLSLAARSMIFTEGYPRVTAVRGTPSGEGVVVAWTALSAVNCSVHLTRVDCDAP